MTPRDRLWRVPAESTVTDDESGEELVVLPEDGELEHSLLEAHAILTRIGGSLVVVADRTQLPDGSWVTVGLAFRYSQFAPAMPRRSGVVRGRVSPSEAADRDLHEMHFPEAEDAVTGPEDASEDFEVATPEEQAMADEMEELDRLPEEDPDGDRPVPALDENVVAGAPRPG